MSNKDVQSRYAMDICNKEIYWLINLSSLNVFSPNRMEEMKSKGWYIQGFNIVADKRWYGRYVFVKLSKKQNNLFCWNLKSF